MLNFMRLRSPWNSDKRGSICFSLNHDKSVRGGVHLMSNSVDNCSCQRIQMNEMVLGHQNDIEILTANNVRRRSLNKNLFGRVASLKPHPLDAASQARHGVDFTLLGQNNKHFIETVFILG